MRAAERLPAQRVSAEVRSLLEGNTDFPTDSLEIYARVNDSEWADWTQKMVNVAVDSTIASRLTYMDFSVETRQRFTDIAEAMLSLNAGTARAATGAL